MNLKEKRLLMDCAMGRKKPDLVLKNAAVADVFTETVRRADIAVKNGYIAGVGSYSAAREIDLGGRTVVPGFIDAHVHMESSMASPDIFTEHLLPHGTAAVVADPHEIANVCGEEGIRYMMRVGAGCRVGVYFALPSCVPLGPRDHGGAVVGAREIARLRAEPRVVALGEVMSYEALLSGDGELMKKIGLMRGRTIDGHSPGLTGKRLQAYRIAGVGTDHECGSYEEALERLRCGFLVQVREGSAARNLEAILGGALRDGISLDRFVFCTDDMHLDDVARGGHIDRCVRMAVELGMDPLKAVKIATLNAARAYGLKELGAVAPGYRADLVVLENLAKVSISDVYVGGVPLRELPAPGPAVRAGERLLNSVRIPRLAPDCLRMRSGGPFPVIGIVPGQIVTKKLTMELPGENGEFYPSGDVLKVAVVRRHDGSGRIGLGAVRGFGLKNGAAASTVAHDSHNLIVIGDNDADMLAAVEELKACGGGYTLVRGQKPVKTLKLNVAGLFTDDRGIDLVKELGEMSAFAHKMGVPENIDVFQNLSFLSLSVLPELRITDSGMFDVGENRFLPSGSFAGPAAGRGS